MGYNTDFEGELLFTKELTATQLSYINTILGEDFRKHPEWHGEIEKELTHVNLILTRNFSGLKWSGDEKSYDMVNKVNAIIHLMKKKWPDFGLTGKLRAQGEDMKDRWLLYINEAGMAVQQPVVFKGQKVKCPSCDEEFLIEKEE